MVNKDVLSAKIGAFERHMARIREKLGVGLSEFLADPDRQESILFNMQMAIQNCIAVAAHIVSEEGLGVAGSTNELFYFLDENGIIDALLTEKMTRAVGFRNLLVHEYIGLDLQVVYRVAREDIVDLELFMQNILRRFG
jgi:uncharacterized protein YutE (UPF0331/DUF86 family)